MFKKACLIFALLGMIACTRPSGEEAFTTRPVIVSETNKFDRVFVLIQGAIWERRWDGVNWSWIGHQDVSSQTNGAALGPLLCNEAANLCRLYILGQAIINQPSPAGGTLQDPRYQWIMYTFPSDELDYTDINNFNIAPFNALDSKIIECNSNLSFDTLFNLYCVKTYEEGILETPLARLMKYDLNLDFMASTEEISIDKGQVDNIDTNYRPCVLSESDVFFLVPVELHHANAQMGHSQHGSVRNPAHRFQDISQGFGTTRCELWETSKKIVGRRFSSTNGWQWDQNGRPIKKRKIHKIAVGSMRISEFGNTTMLIKPKQGNARVYERFNDGSGWQWADHGFPADEVLSELGWVRNGQYFVTTASGDLYQRHWRADLGRWAWENHGQP